MRLITDITDFISDPSTLTIGTFDGVHLGHQRLLRRLIETANQTNTIATVLTFSPHPRIVLGRDHSLRLIQTLTEKVERLKDCGVEQLVVYPFDETFAQMSAVEYITKVLVKMLQVRKTIVGYDHRFGRGRASSTTDLRAYGKHYGFEVIDILAKEVEQITISSTRIRKAIIDGDMSTARSYLGYDFSLRGTIIIGRGVGRSIGYPTTNIIVDDPYKIVPKNGVYAVLGNLEGKSLQGMMNIGSRPTFDDYKPIIEVHWFDIDMDMYDKSIRIYPIAWLRDEQKFATPQLLINQLAIDKESAIKTLNQFQR